MKIIGIFLLLFFLIFSIDFGLDFMISKKLSFTGILETLRGETLTFTCIFMLVPFADVIINKMRSKQRESENN
jgi:hypothetical protein